MDKNAVKIQKRLAKNVISLRNRLNWTQEECAANLEIATAYLSRIERAIVNVTLKNMVKMADGFKVDVSESIHIS